MSRWRPRGRGGGRVVAASALAIAVGVVVAITLGARSSPPPPAAHGSSSASATTTVGRRNLVETDTEPGTLGHADPQTVYNRLSGTITWLPSVGQVMKPGQALFRVSGEPVILMKGSTPAYRDLRPGDSDAPDILELNRNLVALGFDPQGIVVDDAWQAATTAGVDALQAWLNEPETGTLKFGQLVFLPGDRLVSSVSAHLGSPAGLRAGMPAPEFVTLTSPRAATANLTATGGATTRTVTRTSPRPAPKANTLAALLALLKAETAQLRAAEAELHASPNGGVPKPGSNSPPPSRAGGDNNKASGNPGAGNGNGGSATPVLDTSSTRFVVTVQLDPSKQSEARAGRHVTVEMPSGTTVNGRISGVSPIAQSSTVNSGSGGAGGGTNGNSGPGGGNDGNGSGSSTTIPVTIALRGRLSGKGLDQASVSVNFVTARAKHVLSVPVTALLATQGGHYALQDAAPPHSLIPVTTGLFAAGYVAISGRGVHPGLVVADSQG